MAQIRGQYQQFGVEVGTVLVPSQERMDGKGMAKIMEPRPITSPTVHNSTFEQ